MGPPRRRRALRADRRNTQALIIAAIPVVVLLAVIALGVWLVQGRNQPDDLAAAEPTHLPTLPPATLVEVRKTGVPTDAPAAAEATATTAPADTVATAEPTTAPAAATEAPTIAPADDSGGLAKGSSAVVTGTAGRGLRVRTGAGLSEPAVKVLPEGTTVQILDGPRSADGYDWYQVRDAAGVEGWVAADWLVAVAG